MNKYQEALERICNNLICGGECAVGGKPCSLLEPIQELVDKETPKKVIKFTSEITNSEEALTFYTCPKCRMLLSNDNYCPKCGQKLDWSDE